MEHRDELSMLHQLKMINQNVEQTRRSIARKLGPELLTTSTFVRSLLGYLLKEHWTEPHIIDLHCNEEGMLLAYESHLDGYLRLLCSRDESFAPYLDLHIWQTSRQRARLSASWSTAA